MRMRLTFSKCEAMRFTGHLDLHRTWERTFRRTGLPLAYTSGFNPQPRLQLACALPLGFTSQCELLDAWLEASLSLIEIEQALLDAQPPGILLHQVDEVDPHEPSLPSQVDSVVYTVRLRQSASDLRSRIDSLLQSAILPRERRGKPYDLRPLIEALEVSPDDPALIQMRLAAREAATGRPEEVLAALDLGEATARIHRTSLILICGFAWKPTKRR